MKNLLSNNNTALSTGKSSDFDRFLEAYHPRKWASYCKPENIPRLYTGTAPTLGKIYKDHGYEWAAAITKAQIYYLVEMCGCRDKVDTNQLDCLIPNLITHYGYIKITELMHFCYLFVCGEYGHFYGNIDPILISEKLRIFDLGTRRDLHDRYRKEAEQAETDRRHNEWMKRRQRYTARIPGAWTDDALMAFDQYNRTNIDDLSDEEAADEVQLYANGTKSIPADPYAEIAKAFSSILVNHR